MATNEKTLLWLDLKKNISTITSPNCKCICAIVMKKVGEMPSTPRPLNYSENASATCLANHITFLDGEPLRQYAAEYVKNYL